MTDPVAFLAAALDAAQRDAEAATAGPWYAHEYDYNDPCGFEASIGSYRDDSEANIVGHGPEGGGVERIEDARFIAANSPDVVLRRIASDRKILKLHGGAHECSSYDAMSREIDAYHFVLAGETCTTVWMLAESYGCPDVPKCGATTVFWPDDEACDAECMLTIAHDGDHEDEVLGKWEAG